MKFMRVRNWHKFQHYSKRNPPWVKLYTSILDDYEFGCLQDASKLLLTLIPLLAARTNNKIPADPTWIQKKLCLEAVPDLEPLFSIKFIELMDASNTLADCKQSACLTETETEQTETDRDIHTERSRAIKTGITEATRRLLAS